MADTGMSKPNQHAHESSQLTYGHFGTASYDEQEHRWSFLRHFGASRSTIIHDGQSDGLENPSVPFLFVDHLKNVTKNSDAERITERTSSNKISAHALLKFLPQAALGLPMCKDTLSHSATNDQDLSQQSDSCLAFGSISMPGVDDTQTLAAKLPIVAYTTSTDLYRVNSSCLKRRHTYYENGDAAPKRIEIPQIPSSETTMWTSVHGSVRQLSFSTSSESTRGAAMLAVRSDYATSILLLELKDQSILADTAQIESSHVAAIPCSSTGDAAHVDIVWKPISNSQLAIVDEEGNWSIWGLKITHPMTKRILSRAQLIAHASMYEAFHKSGQIGGTPYWRGWHVICWLGTTIEEASRLLICNRRVAVVYSTNGKLQNFVNTRLGSKARQAWILDVKPHPGMSTDCFILTSTKLLWMSTNPERSSPFSSDEALGLVVSWNHFRGRNDRGLRLHIVHTSRSKQRHGIVVDLANLVLDIWVLLSSTACALVTVYQVRDADTEVETVSSMSDPTYFNLIIDSTSDISHISFRIFEAVESEVTASDDMHVLLKAYIQYADGVVNETSYLVRDKGENAQNLHHDRIAPFPFSTSRIAKSARFIEESAMDDFITSDQDIVSDVDIQLRGLSSQTVRHVNTIQNFIDLRPIYTTFVDDHEQLHLARDENLATYLKNVDNQATSLQYMHLISDIQPIHPRILEIEEDSEKLQAWLHKHYEMSDDNLLYSTTSSQISNFFQEHMMEIYENIVQDWITTLDSSIPDRNRVYKERLARLVALEICLSSITIQQVNDIGVQEVAFTADFNTVDTSSQSQFGQIDLNIVPSSPTRKFDDMHLAETRPKNLLESYVKFTKPLPQGSHSIETEDILAHIPKDICTDPALYNYRNTEASIVARKNELNDEGRDLKSKRRAEKIARARQKQLEKQQRFRDTTLKDHASLPNVLSSQLPIRNVQSSQAVPQTSSQVDNETRTGINMTQPERGVFGGRDGKTTKTKRRTPKMAGF